MSDVQFATSMTRNVDTIELSAVNKRYRREYLFDVTEMERIERRKPVLEYWT